MTTNTPAPSPAASAPAAAADSQAKQKLLAFASLIVLMVIFSVLKPDAFFTTDNIIGIL